MDIWMKIRKNGTGKYAVCPVGHESVANRLLYSSAWSCKTGKRIKSSLRCGLRIA